MDYFIENTHSIKVLQSLNGKCIKIIFCKLYLESCITVFFFYLSQPCICVCVYGKTKSYK